MNMSLNKKLLKEIYRNKQLMFGKTLLSEQSAGIFGKISDLASDFLARTEKKINPTTGTRSIGGVENLTQRTLDDIETVISNPSLIVTLSREELQTLGKILLQSDEIVQKTYTEIVREFLEKNPTASERSLIEALKNEADKTSKEASTILYEMTGDIMVTEIIKKKFSKKIDDLKKGKFTTEIVRELSDKAKLLTPDEIKAFNKVIESKTAKVFIEDVTQLFKKDLDQLKKEIYELSIGFEQSILEKTPEEIKNLVNAYALSISRKLDMIEIKANGAANDILENSGLSKEIVDKLKTSDDAFFKVFRNERAADSQSLIAVLGDTLKSFLKEIGEIVTGVFKKEGNTLLKIFDPRTSVGQWFYTAQWATFSKLWKLAIKTSAGQNKAKYIAAAAFASAVGSLVGTTLSGVGYGLYELFGLGGWNLLIDKLGGKDNTIFGYTEEELKADIGDTIEYKNVVSKILSPILENGFNIIVDEFKKEGMLPVLLSMVPGGVLTYDNSLFSNILTGIVPGEDYMPSIRKGIYKLLGTSEEEVNKEVKETEEIVRNTPTTEGTVPDDLKTLMGNRSEEIKVKSDNTLFWGTEEYVVEKRNGEWKVYFPPSPELGEPGGWYLVSDMEL
jgi:hypothetical protein